MNKKYEMLKNDTIKVDGGILYRIKALKDFGSVKMGDLGGYIEKETNLSHDGNCWVYGNACVYGDAYVFGNARVSGDAWVFGDAYVYGNAYVFGNARVSGDAWVFGDAYVFGNARVSGDARVYGNACVCDYANVHGCAKIFGDAKVYYKANIGMDANIADNGEYYVAYLYIDSISPASFYLNEVGKIRVGYQFCNEPIEKFEELVNDIFGSNPVYLEQAKNTIHYAKQKLIKPEKCQDINIKFNTKDVFSTKDIRDRCERTTVTSVGLAPNGGNINVIEHVSLEKGPHKDKTSYLRDALLHSMGLKINYIDTDTADYNSNILHYINKYGYSIDDYILTSPEFMKRYTDCINTTINEERDTDKIKSDINKRYGIYGSFRKYEMLLDDTIDCGYITLYRIRALRNFNDVKKGDLGGYIEKEENLSHEDDCWVYGGAKVYGNARIFDRVIVCGFARVFDDAEVHGDAKVFGDAKVYGNALISGNVQVYDNTRVTGNAQVYGNAKICGDARVEDTTYIGNDGYIVNSNSYYNVPYTIEDGITRIMTIYKTKSDVMMVSIPGVCNCSFNKLINKGIDNVAIKSDKSTLKYIGHIDDDIVKVYKDGNNITIKSKMFNGDIVDWRLMINIMTNSIYRTYQYPPHAYYNKLKLLYKYDKLINAALKYFKDNNNNFKE